jgi:hypothetical protein
LTGIFAATGASAAFKTATGPAFFAAGSTAATGPFLRRRRRRFDERRDAAEQNRP